MILLKQILLATTLFLVIAGCNRNPTYDPPTGIEGPWEGISIAGYPGAADEPLVDTVRIDFLFEDGRFTYAGRLSPSDTLIIQHGSYTEKGDTLWLEPDASIYAYHPLYLTGGYTVELEGSSLRLYQSNGQPGWSDYHDVKLERVLPMPD